MIRRLVTWALLRIAYWHSWRTRRLVHEANRSSRG